MHGKLAFGFVNAQTLESPDLDPRYGYFQVETLKFDMNSQHFKPVK